MAQRYIFQKDAEKSTQAKLHFKKRVLSAFSIIVSCTERSLYLFFNTPYILCGVKTEEVVTTRLKASFVGIMGDKRS